MAVGIKLEEEDEVSLKDCRSDVVKMESRKRKAF